MTTKPKEPAGSAVPSNVRVLQLREVAGESHDVTCAKFSTKPETAAAATTATFNQLASDVDVNRLVEEMNRQTKLVNDGDLARAEAMLLSQAHSLDAMFNEFARRAALNMGQYLEATDTYMRMAFKAQSQCRATLQTLGEIKAPRSIAFIRQANLANGPQQVNNGVAAAPRAETSNPTNELLEASHGNWMDTRATGTAGGIDPAMAAVEPVDGPAKRGG